MVSFLVLFLHEIRRRNLSSFVLSLSLSLSLSPPSPLFWFPFVCSDFESRMKGARMTTRIKRVSGDQDTFIEELASVLEIPPEKQTQIRVRTGGTIEIDGNRVTEVKTWLQSLGF